MSGAADPARRRLLKAGGGALLLMVNRGSYALGGSGRKYSSRAVKLVEQATPIDMLAPVALTDAEFDRWAHGEGMTAAEQQVFRGSGIKVMHHSFGIGGPQSHEEALEYFGDLNGFITRYPDLFVRVRGVADIDALKANGKIGIIPGLQNADEFRTPEDVDQLYKLGQRVAQLTYNAQNLLGCGSTERSDCGVTDFGAAIIERMNQAGMLVDVSHCGDRTTLDAFAISKKPVAITHSNCRALNNHPRLKTDEAIRKMAAAGGVMGITGVRMFVKGDEPTTLGHMADHIDHVAQLVGVEHVGIGSDADLKGYDAQPKEWVEKLKAGYKASYGFRERIDIEGFDHPKKLYDLTEELVRRKRYSDADILGILGGNFRRLLGQVWA